MNHLTELKRLRCPSCGAPINLDVKSHIIRCEYCDTEFINPIYEQTDVKEVSEAIMSNQDVITNLIFDLKTIAHSKTEKTKITEKTEVTEKPKIKNELFEAVQLHQFQKEALDSLMAYVCPSCGKTMITNRNHSISWCPHCGCETLNTADVTNQAIPDSVIPFHLNEKQAYKKFKNCFNPGLPISFTRKNMSDEMQAIYVPYYLFKANLHLDGEYLIESSELGAIRSGNVCFDSYAVRATTQLNSDLATVMEPFSFKDAVPFDMNQLEQASVLLNDIPLFEETKKAVEYVQTESWKGLESTIKDVSSSIPVKKEMQVESSEMEYVLCPIYILKKQWHHKTYCIAINGQNGSVVGDMPTSINGKITSFIRDCFYFLLYFMIFTLGIFAFLAPVFALERSWRAEHYLQVSEQAKSALDTRSKKLKKKEKKIAKKLRKKWKVNIQKVYAIEFAEDNEIKFTRCKNEKM